jgi:starvation-inducible outer membrane lipoprotein
MQRRNAWMRSTLILLAATTLLSACQTVPRDIVLRCGTIKDLSKEEQARAAEELRKLPPGTVIGGFIVPDWLRMRDEIRACRGKK